MASRAWRDRNPLQAMSRKFSKSYVLDEESDPEGMSSSEESESELDRQLENPSEESKQYSA